MILVTCFEPFGNNAINASQQAVMALPDGINGVQIIKAVLPVSFQKVEGELLHLIEQYHPDTVICVGMASKRNEITPERIAINIDDSKMADNEGLTPFNTPIHQDAPAAYFSTLPIHQIVAAIQANGIPASISNTAGTFVCNHIFYCLMHAITTKHPNVKGGFIHVPIREDNAKALEIAIQQLV